MNLRRRITRAEYDQLLANCAARISLQMERLQLKPAELQKRSTQAVYDQQQKAAISMQDLAAYRFGRALPKDDKLRALAHVLQCSPTDLVPQPYQSGRLLVHRKVDAAFEGRVVKVEPSEALPGNAWVTVRIMLPTAKAHAFAKASQRQHVIEEMRRCGHSEDEIKGHFEAAEQRAEAG